MVRVAWTDSAKCGAENVTTASPNDVTDVATNLRNENNADGTFFIGIFRLVGCMCVYCLTRGDDQLN